MIKHLNRSSDVSGRLLLLATLTLGLALPGCGEADIATDSGSAAVGHEGHAHPDSVSSEKTTAAREVPLGDIVLGSENASITIIEYASMTCSHCADFHKFAFKRIKENYIDSGKVRFVFREFPLDSYALQATVLARCMGTDQYFEMVDLLFNEQLDWVMSKDIGRSLRRYARDKGLSDDEYVVK